MYPPFGKAAEYPGTYLHVIELNKNSIYCVLLCSRSLIKERPITKTIVVQSGGEFSSYSKTLKSLVSKEATFKLVLNREADPNALLSV